MQLDLGHNELSAISFGDGRAHCRLVIATVVVSSCGHDSSWKNRCICRFLTIPDEFTTIFDGSQHAMFKSTTYYRIRTDAAASFKTSTLTNSLHM
jgi:hypothetical protein